ncbi:hypothetical protein LEP1GSC048_3036 [Leptospira santarosai serovar Shermani str. 1342KT]|nr:hypothetical protein LEP1GSC040_1912 [Leptospira santarosai str. 2000030832]EPG83881.1 hypothetical protein LEP1GSC048_3036 [Leptospira santarosai serovar Shermani str. 1342KT]
MSFPFWCKNVRIRRSGSVGHDGKKWEFTSESNHMDWNSKAPTHLWCRNIKAIIYKRNLICGNSTVSVKEPIPRKILRRDLS